MRRKIHITLILFCMLLGTDAKYEGGIGSGTDIDILSLAEAFIHPLAESHRFESAEAAGYSQLRSVLLADVTTGEQFQKHMGGQSSGYFQTETSLLSETLAAPGFTRFQGADASGYNDLWFAILDDSGSIDLRVGIYLGNLGSGYNAALIITSDLATNNIVRYQGGGGSGSAAVRFDSSGTPPNPTPLQIREQTAAFIYPNPVLHKIFFSRIPDEEITITDLKGKIVLKAEPASNQLDVSHLEEGTYLLTTGASVWKFYKTK